MPRTILFTFGDDTQRDKFLGLVKSAALASPEEKFLLDSLNTVKLDPPIKTEAERTAGLFVSGSKLIEGPLSDMKKRFDQEIVSHSASVEVKELRDGEWKVIHSRKRQN